MSTAEHSHDDPEALDPEAMKEWVRPLMHMHVWCRKEHGQWYVLAEEFDITGMGDTEEAAYQDMLGLLAAYLSSHYADGASFEDAMRPIPAKLKRQIRMQAALSAVRNAAARVLSRTPRSQSQEYSTLISADSVLRAHC
jgi:hypothetical protein